MDKEKQDSERKNSEAEAAPSGALAEKRPKLQASSRLFGRLAGATLSAAAARPTSENDVKRRELEEKLQAKLRAEREEQQERMAVDREKQRQERMEREEKDREEWNRKKSQVLQDYKQDQDSLSTFAFHKTTAEPCLYWKAADSSCIVLKEH
ncbi:hypothetical protein HDV03_003353 [Kappamyces sp. JEL0829]|nr:hypothetical protein HDV03_003353 [Kappamyces sp. JEL0829]